MQSYILPLALLFIAFSAPSIAQSAGAVSTPEPAPAAEEPVVPGEDDLDRDVLMFDLYHPLQFNCTMRDITDYQWVRNGTVLSDFGEQKGLSLLEGGALLVVKRAHESDHGNYTCRVGGVTARAWEARARPLARVSPNTNVVEGQTVSIACKLVGRPYTRVTWRYAEEAPAPAADGSVNGTGAGVAIDMGAADARFSTKPSAAGVPDGELTLRGAALADAGVYWCAPEGGVPAYTTLRVKDVYAALWPFLGICLEVFILCAIILVYEKRRTKPELDDSDADAHDQKRS